MIYTGPLPLGYLSIKMICCVSCRKGNQENFLATYSSTQQSVLHHQYTVVIDSLRDYFAASAQEPGGRFIMTDVFKSAIRDSE